LLRKEECTQDSIEVCAVPEAVDEAEVEEGGWNNNDCPGNSDGPVSPVKGIGDFCDHCLNWYKYMYMEKLGKVGGSTFFGSIR
jgi:hypothetical protein